MINMNAILHKLFPHWVPLHLTPPPPTSLDRICRLVDESQLDLFEAQVRELEARSHVRQHSVMYEELKALRAQMIAEIDEGAKHFIHKE